MTVFDAELGKRNQWLSEAPHSRHSRELYESNTFMHPLRARVINRNHRAAHRNIIHSQQ